MLPYLVPFLKAVYFPFILNINVFIVVVVVGINERITVVNHGRALAVSLFGVFRFSPEFASATFIHD
jgi:hypothetical protein